MPRVSISAASLPAAPVISDSHPSLASASEPLSTLLSDRFEGSNLSSAPVETNPCATAESLRAHLDVSDLPQSRRKEELAARVELLLMRPQFALDELVKRTDLMQMQTVLADVRKKAKPWVPILLRENTRVNLQRLDAAIDSVRSAWGQQIVSSEELNQLLHQRSLPDEKLLRLVKTGGRFSKGDDPLAIDDVFMAINSCKLQRLSALIEAGARPDHLHAFGLTPLHFAAAYLAEAIPMLTRVRADLNVFDNQGETPLHTAAKSDNAQAAIALLEAGANPSFKDPDGNTPLHVAILHSRHNAFSALFYKSNLFAKNNDGHAPLDCAERSKRGGFSPWLQQEELAQKNGILNNQDPASLVSRLPRELRAMVLTYVDGNDYYEPTKRF